MVDYLQHSSRGTSWVKKQHEYNKKIRKRYYYAYEAALKKLWKLKKKIGDSEEYQKAKADYINNRQREAKYKANKHVADIYNDVADKTGSGKTRKTAEEYQRRVNDAIPNKVMRIKLVDITKDQLSKGKLILKSLLRKRSK